MRTPVMEDLRLTEPASVRELCGGSQGMVKVRTQPPYLVSFLNFTRSTLAYAYILSPNNLCASQGVLCNDDFGISLGRGAFRLQAGQ